MENLKFSDNLRTALSESNKTQKNLADFLGTTQATVSRWIAGINEPDLKTFVKICEFLEETPNSLLGYEE